MLQWHKTFSPLNWFILTHLSVVLRIQSKPRINSLTDLMETLYTSTVQRNATVQLVKSYGKFYFLTWSITSVTMKSDIVMLYCLCPLGKKKENSKVYQLRWRTVCPQSMKVMYTMTHPTILKILLEGSTQTNPNHFLNKRHESREEICLSFLAFTLFPSFFHHPAQNPFLDYKIKDNLQNYSYRKEMTSKGYAVLKRRGRNERVTRCVQK